MENNSYNPDVLNCLANLSNDEVFTPPTLANQMIDLLPQELFSDPKATFLDPFCKSGVFLREIVKRLDRGLQNVIPDRRERIDHIMHKQVFGIAITELTSLLSRRSLYCSKHADGEHSVSRFDTPEGNLRYTPLHHTWERGKCRYCGASQEVYDRGEASEQYAYQFIHTDNPERIFNMKFDVIIGNPPYQLDDGGGTGSSAMPIYQMFVEQAMRLNPRYLTMIIPSRWFTGGRGLDIFREKMLNDKHITILHDFISASDCFPGVEIKGGVCYFLWERDKESACHIYTHKNNEIGESTRYLLEKGSSIFIRNNEAISILHKVQCFHEKTFSNIVSANDPFGFDVRVANSYKRIKPDFRKEYFEGASLLYYNGWRKNGLGYISGAYIRKNQSWKDCVKVFIPKAWGVGDPSTDWLTPFIPELNSVCTETYLVVGPFDTIEEANNAIAYTQTRFFHLLVSLVKITQNTMQKAYTFVPLQDFSHPWTDEMLYKKYNLTEEEIAFIESMIRPME